MTVVVRASGVPFSACGWIQMAAIFAGQDDLVVALDGQTLGAGFVSPPLHRLVQASADFAPAQPRQLEAGNGSRLRAAQAEGEEARGERKR
jgi:hypothetical protein